LYGNILDVMMKLVGIIPDGGVVFRVVFYVLGMFVCAAGVSLLFHTYITPEAYELFVKEISEKYKFDIHVIKTAYDCCSCVIAILMSFVFNGFLVFEGVKAGTIVCAVVNGWLIGRFTSIFEKHFEFKDAFKLRKYF